MRINYPKQLNQDQENLLNSLDVNKIKNNQLTTQELRDLINNNLIPYDYVLYAKVQIGLLNMPVNPQLGQGDNLKYRDVLTILAEDETKALVVLSIKDEKGNYNNIKEAEKMEVFINASGKDNIYNIQDAITERNNMIDIDTPILGV